jgi:two-component system OmpR family sensor kinase
MAVGLVVFAAALLWGTSRVLFEQLDQAIAASAFLAAERLVHPAPQGTLDAMVADEPSRYAREVNRYIVLRQVDGSVAGAQPRRAATLPLDTAAFRAAQAGRQVWLTQAWSGRAVRVTYVAVSEQGVRGERVIQAAASLDPIHAVRRDLFFALAAVVLVGTAATFLGAWALAGSAVRPVSEIIEQATRIEPGGPEPRIVAHAETEEYRGLVAVLNGMLERLDRAFRAQRRLTADVSHELRTPLTALRGEMEVALRAERSPREYQQVLRSALEEIERLSVMSEDLLLITRAESRLVVPDRRATDLDRLIGDAVDQLHRRCEEKDLRVATAFGIGRDGVPVDAKLARRLVTHLLENAIRHSPHGGRIGVTTDIADGNARLVVQDSGPGLTEQDLAHLFQPFYRGDPARTRDTGGGLGLALARAVVDLHGGRIRAGNAPSGGARFEIEFPLAPPPREG